MSDLSDLAAAIGPLERYCIESGRPVIRAGDRCLSHGAAADMCATDVRPGECEHPRLSPNHPFPRCSECGRDLPPEDYVAIRRFGQPSPSRFIRRAAGR